MLREVTQEFDNREKQGEKPFPIFKPNVTAVGALT